MTELPHDVHGVLYSLPTPHLHPQPEVYEVLRRGGCQPHDRTAPTSRFLHVGLQLRSQNAFAGIEPGSLLVAEAWTSRQQHERTLHDHIQPALHDLCSHAGPPQPLAPTTLLGCFGGTPLGQFDRLDTGIYGAVFHWPGASTTYDWYHQLAKLVSPTSERPLFGCPGIFFAFTYGDHTLALGVWKSEAHYSTFMSQIWAHDQLGFPDPHIHPAIPCAAVSSRGCHYVLAA